MRRTTEPRVPKAFVSDNGLIGAVREALTQSADIATGGLSVSARDGVVLLTGTVGTLYQKRIAGRFARATKGVVDVENDLVVVPDHYSPDDQVKKALDQAFSSYRPERIGVRQVQQGLAYLSGKASSASEAWNAIDLASKVKGVKGVISEIDVAPGYPVDDISIKNRVIDSVCEDPRIDPYSIEVFVEEAHVYLSGEVEDQDAVKAAGELASKTPGVQRVINHLVAREQKP